MTIRKYKRYIKKVNEIDVYSLRRINIFFRTKKAKIENIKYIEQIQKYFDKNSRFEVNYYWTSCAWVYEFEFDNFRIYESEFDKYFIIDETAIRKEKLNKIGKSVQS